MNTSAGSSIVSRREFLGSTLAAGASLTLTPTLLSAFQNSEAASGTLIQRAIPSSKSGEKLPVIGLGRGWSKSLDEAALKEVIKTLVDHGGSVIDTVHGGPDVRQLVSKIVHDLGIQNKIFWTTGLMVAGGAGGPPPAPGKNGEPPQTPKVDPAAVKAEIEKLFAMFKVPKIDLIQVMAHADVPTHLAVLREMKKEGRVRYIGVTDLLLPPNMPPPSGMQDPLARFESTMRNEEIDFIGVDYSVGDRRIEQKLLPLAQERKIGVMAYFPFDRSRIFKRANETPLPDWAAEFDAKTWAQFFLKYVVSHPAVTVARAGTSNPKHMLDNIGGGIGRLPDEAMRKRMAELVDSWPGPPQNPQAPQPGRAVGG